MSLSLTPVNLEPLSAAECADLFLSPFVDSQLLCSSTSEEGPSLWLVNRSDVYDQSLESLSMHPIEGISKRAREKLAARRSLLILLNPPEDTGPLEEVPDHSIEDVLGHPLVDLQSVLFFSYHLNQDHRASAALSLVRRLLEHPPGWTGNSQLKLSLTDRFFELLLSDSSALVRYYAAAIPLFEARHLSEAFSREAHPRVLARLLQNPAASIDLILNQKSRSISDATFSRVLALDSRWPRSARLEHVGLGDLDPMAHAIHQWYLANAQYL